MSKVKKVLIRRDYVEDMLDAMKLLRKYVNKGPVTITDVGNVNESIIAAIESELEKGRQ